MGRSNRAIGHSSDFVLGLFEFVSDFDIRISCLSGGEASRAYRYSTIWVRVLSLGQSLISVA